MPLFIKRSRRRPTGTGLGDERARNIEFVASDMWAAFLDVVRSRCGHALHVLDRFRVMQLMSKAIDQTRRDEVRRLRAKEKHAALTKARARAAETQA